ncbi:succinate dehydrogenase [Ectothiorhodospira haloalkaliphila]|uniref:Succinate dehydrogenase hydrophobic membrane anchor subunit n=1 Tax=Ectothiorhodospira haloalkaliphila TaxID=421628 RepID=W8KVD8_9GAMM|nr:MULTISPECIES: succinate dehydrogenase, hydrophobic membrane anchor protein [Ectothiorhodospira]AHK79541.1 succinate dehydrogenase [Ectothiorhodospira haloalkaliphila]MCG5492998.1 succinate dehydrogenase, hydrophobic membrane anchor protein [Ectothiorhodospira variabilis]MCG5497281.1 succinate dehydrogenase, hydrophobic membrane anchor protein [Ectothiorhodospira variabilis]MCG5502327.1 succinate dehydrogenase, hydrophobic membrane anchor protein [Ectothiorhodospira variabilis]MCG5505907.1 s
MSLRTPLSQARGLGSAKDGTHHWFVMRVSSIAMVPLMLWLIFSLGSLAGAGFEATSAWVANPLNTVLLILTVGALFHHAYLGLQVIIEDYVHGEGKKFASLIAMQFLMLLLAVTGIVAILRIAFGS